MLTFEGQMFESSLDFFCSQSTIEEINYKHKVEARGKREKEQLDKVAKREKWEEIKWKNTHNHSC